MDNLYFGTGGCPHSSRNPSTLSGLERLAELKLGAMELEFVQRVNLGEGAAKVVGEVASKLGVKLTAHAPYYINFNSQEPEKVQASQKRLLLAAHIAKLCGATSVVFHPGFYMKNSAEQVYQTIKTNLEPVVKQVRESGNNIWIRPEVMGRVSQFGTLEEVLNLSLELEGVMPCIDFAHWHARNGRNNSYAEFTAVFELVEKRLGRQALEDVHLHVSGIRYGDKGELSHLDLAEADMNYRDLLKAFRDTGIRGIVICESPSLEADAQVLRDAYLELAG